MDEDKGFEREVLKVGQNFTLLGFKMVESKDHSSPPSLTLTSTEFAEAQEKQRKTQEECMLAVCEGERPRIAEDNIPALVGAWRGCATRSTFIHKIVRPM